MMIEYPHWMPGERVVLVSGVGDGYTLIQGKVYTVVRTDPPTKHERPRLHLNETPAVLDPASVTLVPPAMITDAERVAAACRVEFYGVQTLGGHWFSVTDSPINSRFPSTQDAKSALEALDCWVMELRRREGKQ